MGSPIMEIRKFGRRYSEVLEVMMEHAKMEETVLFPIFDMADRGLSKAAKEEHARDLPIMNGIKEDIKTVGVLNSGSPDYREALYNLSNRLKSLLGHCKQHFREEEVELLPLMEALELSKEQEENALEQCFVVMQGTHGRLLKLLLEGLQPNDAMKYLDLISKCRDKERMESILQMIMKESDKDEDGGSNSQHGKQQLKLSNVGFTTSKRRSEEIESSGKGRSRFFQAQKLEHLAYF